MKKYGGTVGALASLLVSAMIAFSQSNTGTFSGTVTDPSGAAIANVQVSVVDIDTNFQSRATTNADGLWRVSSLQPSTYRITFEAAGFKRMVQSGLELHVGDVIPVNATLELGQLSDSVQVSAQSTLLGNRDFFHWDGYGWGGAV